jgi:citronellyl-CoA synthetase
MHNHDAVPFSTYRDTVAVMVLNRPEMVASWIGLGKIGLASALINTNSTGKFVRKFLRRPYPLTFRDPTTL